MTNMKNYLAWIQQNQKNNPEWQAANKWQNRNQTPVQKTPSSENTLPEGSDTEIVDEHPEE